MFQIASCRENKPDLLSAALMRVMRANYSHVIIIENGDTVYHATGKGFHAEPLSEVLKAHTLPDIIEVNCPDESLANGYLRRMIGMDYSESQFLGFIFPFMKPFFRNRHQRAICSEAVSDFLKDCCGCEINEDTDYIDPVKAIAYARTVEVNRG